MLGDAIGIFSIKTAISAIIIVVVSEISKRSYLFGTILASLPLFSLLNTEKIFIDRQ